MSNVSLRRRHDLLTRLLRLARRQGESLEQERLDLFLELMEERARLFAGLIDEGAPLPDNVVLFAPPAETPDADLQVAVSALISTILEQDAANEALLQLEMERVQAAMAQIGRGFAAVRAYAGAVRPLSEPRLQRLLHATPTP